MSLDGQARREGTRPGARGECGAQTSSETLRRVEPSEEIRRVVHRWLVANRDGDADAVIARVSERPGLLAIGTDPGEWWHTPERAVWRRQVEESGGFPLDWGEIEACRRAPSVGRG